MGVEILQCMNDATDEDGAGKCIGMMMKDVKKKIDAEAAEKKSSGTTVDRL